MRKTTVLACALALSGFVAAPAFADCQADLTATEAAAAKATDATAEGRCGETYHRGQGRAGEVK